MPGWGIPLNRDLQNFELLNRWSCMDQIFGMGMGIKSKLNLTKLGGATMGVSHPKFKLNLLG